MVLFKVEKLVDDVHYIIFRFDVMETVLLWFRDENFHLVGLSAMCVRYIE